MFSQQTFSESSSAFFLSATVRQQKRRDNNGREIDWNAQRDELLFFAS